MRGLCVQLYSIIIAPLLLLTPILIENEALLELDPMEVVAEAESFMPELNIRREKFLIMDVSHRLAQEASQSTHACSFSGRSRTSF